MGKKMTNSVRRGDGRRFYTWVHFVLLSFALFQTQSVLGARVSLKAFDWIADSVDLEYIRSGTSDIKQLPMALQVFGVWQADFQVPAGDYEYRFVADGEWISDISNPEFNQWGDGSVWSTFSLADKQDLYANYRINAPAQPPATRYHAAVTYKHSEEASVSIAGEFNSWRPQEMRRMDGSTWRTSFDLEQGTYAYKFILDGEWILDPANPHVKTVNGIDNSALVVTTNTAVDPDEVIPVDPAGKQVAVTFQFYAPLATDVAVVGIFNQWNGERNPMALKNGLWTCTVPLPEGTYEYKFKVGNDWYWDPDRPPESTGENSVLTVKRHPPPLAGQKALIQPEAWKDTPPPILLEPATGLHAFQQELMRAYIYVIGSDRYNLSIADGSLLNPDRLPGNPPARWGWSIDTSDGRSMMTLAVQSNTAAFELKHPLLGPPQKWLATQRGHAEKIYADCSLDFSGPEVPPTNSSWATARQELAKQHPFSEVVAVNRMTDFGRNEGWSHELLRELAVTYADLSRDYRYISIGGWSPMVFAARAVVYADLARTGEPTDETMAYVLCRIGRPGDGTAFLPEQPETLHGHLAAAMGRRDLAPLLSWAGTPDNYGLELIPGQVSRPPAMEEFTAHQQAQILSTLADLLHMDDQENLARCYRSGAHDVAPDNFAILMRGLELGGITAGHSYANISLKLIGCARLWESVLKGTAPVLCKEPDPEWPFAVCREPLNPESMGKEIARISSLYQKQQREILDGSSEAIPASARLLMLRDMLNIAWWRNARYRGVSYYSKSDAQELNQIMATWKPFQPEMGAFVRFLLTDVMDDHGYGAIKQGFIDRGRKPNTLDYICMVKSAFNTWLMNEAQRFYPLVPTVQSDLMPDYRLGEEAYVFLGMDHLRGQCRRLDPMAPYGYPAPGGLPAPDHPGDIPDALFEHSYALNRRLAGDWARSFDKESQETAIAFYQRCLTIAPEEVDEYYEYADILMDNGRYEEVLALVDAFPDTMEGLQQAAIYRTGTFAALHLGDTRRALDYMKVSASSGQSLSLTLYAFVLEVTGDLKRSLEVLEGRDRRYNGHNVFYLLAREMPEKAEEYRAELCSWIEQFPDLEQANAEERFSFNSLKGHPYYYAVMGDWERSLWILKPLAEAVQNDYIWFMLMAVGQKTGDQTAMELGQHVLANHVFNAWGDFARYMRHQTTWEEVLNAARNDDTPQPMYYLAAVMAEQRGDTALAVRLYKQALTPRHSTRTWFTLSWKALQRLDHDPLAFIQRNFLADFNRCDLILIPCFPIFPGLFALSGSTFD